MKIEWNKLTVRERDGLIDRLVFEREQQYHLMKSGLYYRPPANGYTDNPLEAARYSLEEARSHGRGSGEVRMVPCTPLPYTTSIAAAFQVVEKMEAKGHRLSLYRHDCEDGITRTFCAFDNVTVEFQNIIVAFTDTSEAISFAALEKMGHELIIPMDEP